MASTFMVRTSERGTFKRCPQRWWWSHVENLTSIRSKPALWFGTAVHESLAEWYQQGTTRGAHPAETILKVLDPMRKIIVRDEEDEVKFVQAQELGVQMMNRYVDNYGTDPSWDVIATEQTFQVWIPHPKRTGRWMRYVGTADGVYRDLDTGEIKLMEHKTASSISTSHLGLDDQAGSYWAIMNGKLRKMGVLGKRESIAGITYNILRKALNDERPQNADGLYTNKPIKKHYVDAIVSREGFPHEDLPGETWTSLGKWSIEDLKAQTDKWGITVFGEPSASQPPPYFERLDVYRSAAERKTMITRIQNEGLHMEAIRTGALPLYKTPSQSGFLACTSCEFFRLCQMHESGEEYFEDYKAAEFITRDPYEDHRNKKSTDS